MTTALVAGLSKQTPRSKPPTRKTFLVDLSFRVPRPNPAAQRWLGDLRGLGVRPVRQSCQPAETNYPAAVPELSRFYGIIIRMFYGDHPPPHFHAVYQGEEMKVNINTLEVIEGDMPRRARALVLEWAALHRAELRQAWDLASRNQEPSKIPPLE
jgi:hypothetical protein